MGGVAIVTVVPIGLQPVLDFTVPQTHCYESGGVIHHNTGKTDLGAFEVAVHMTGLYPDWWQGRRFPASIKGWAAGDTSKTVREIIQPKLVGDEGAIGTGMIPAHTIHHISHKANGAGMIDTIWVKHVSGGLSSMVLKSYMEGRKSFQGTAMDLIWLDEEPEEAIYTECVMRTMTTNGLILMTFTPLSGLTPLVLKFMQEATHPGETTPGIDTDGASVH